MRPRLLRPLGSKAHNPRGSATTYVVTERRGIPRKKVAAAIGIATTAKAIAGVNGAAPKINAVSAISSAALARNFVGVPAEAMDEAT